MAISKSLSTKMTAQKKIEHIQLLKETFTTYYTQQARGENGTE